MKKKPLDGARENFAQNPPVEPKVPGNYLSLECLGLKTAGHGISGVIGVVVIVVAFLVAVHFAPQIMLALIGVKHPPWSELSRIQSNAASPRE